MSKYPSFVRGRQFWMPERSGSYARDCAQGRAYADELVEHIRGDSSPNLVGSVVAAMIGGGRYEGVEVGFCARLGEIAMTGGLPARRSNVVPIAAAAA